MDRRLELVREGCMTIQEAVLFSGVGRSFLYEAMKRGELPYVKIGSARRIPKRALEEWLAKNVALSNRLDEPAIAEENTDGEAHWSNYWEKWKARDVFRRRLEALQHLLEDGAIEVLLLKWRHRAKGNKEWQIGNLGGIFTSLESAKDNALTLVEALCGEGNGGDKLLIEWRDGDGNRLIALGTCGHVELAIECVRMNR